MTPEAFAAAIKTTVFDSAVQGVSKQLANGAPGQGPHPRADAMSTWYSTLDSRDRAMVAEVIRDAAHSAVFGLLCVLDGVRAVDVPPHVALTLTAVTQTGEAITLASEASRTSLHDHFNAEVHPPSEPWPDEIA